MSYPEVNNNNYNNNFITYVELLLIYTKIKARLHLTQLTVTQKDLKANQADEQQKIETDSIVPFGERK